MTKTTETAEHRATRYLIADMAMLIGKLAYTLKRYRPDHPIALSATDFLRRHNLQGSPLRADNGGPVKTGTT